MDLYQKMKNGSLIEVTPTLVAQVIDSLQRAEDNKETNAKIGNLSRMVEDMCKKIDKDLNGITEIRLQLKLVHPSQKAV